MCLRKCQFCPFFRTHALTHKSNINEIDKKRNAREKFDINDEIYLYAL